MEWEDQVVGSVFQSSRHIGYWVLSDMYVQHDPLANARREPDSETNAFEHITS